VANQACAARKSPIEGLVMRVGVIGAGKVGSACALALIMRGAAREIVLVDRTRERARAVATDLRYACRAFDASHVEPSDQARLSRVESHQRCALVRTEPRRLTDAAAASFGIARSSLQMILPASPRLNMRPTALAGTRGALGGSIAWHSQYCAHRQSQRVLDNFSAAAAIARQQSPDSISM
jgi:glycine/D-amino acid oxidase-like deaminating enzyme